MRCLRYVGSLNFQLSLAKEPNFVRALLQENLDNLVGSLNYQVAFAKEFYFCRACFQTMPDNLAGSLNYQFSFAKKIDCRRAFLQKRPEILVGSLNCEVFCAKEHYLGRALLQKRRDNTRAPQIVTSLLQTSVGRALGGSSSCPHCAPARRPSISQNASQQRSLDNESLSIPVLSPLKLISETIWETI